MCVLHTQLVWFKLGLPDTFTHWLWKHHAFIESKLLLPGQVWAWPFWERQKHTNVRRGMWNAKCTCKHMQITIYVAVYLLVFICECSSTLPNQSHNLLWHPFLRFKRESQPWVLIHLKGRLCLCKPGVQKMWGYTVCLKSLDTAAPGRNTGIEPWKLNVKGQRT